ncbi:MAG: DUF2949 domain-containing protein [Thermosynechococcaceae cyanobacterium]
MDIKKSLVSFLQKELALPAQSIALADRHPEYPPTQLPMILWQYGLITLEELGRTWDWLDNADIPEFES